MTMTYTHQCLGFMQNGISFDFGLKHDLYICWGFSWDSQDLCFNLNAPSSLFCLFSRCLWFSKFRPWIFNADDLLGLPKTAPVVTGFSDLSAEVTTRDCCSIFIKARSPFRGEQQFAPSLHPHALAKSPLVGSCLTRNGKRTCRYANGTLRHIQGLAFYMYLL